MALATSPYLNRPRRNLVHIVPRVGWYEVSSNDEPFRASSLGEAIDMARAVYGRDCVIMQKGH